MQTTSRMISDPHGQIQIRVAKHFPGKFLVRLSTFAGDDLPEYVERKLHLESLGCHFGMAHTDVTWGWDAYVDEETALRIQAYDLSIPARDMTG